LGDQVKEAENGRACDICGEEEKCFQCLAGKREGKGLHEGRTHGWEDKIKMDLKEIGWKKVEWTDLTKDRD
jgi:hypothetical protein